MPEKKSKFSIIFVLTKKLIKIIQHLPYYTRAMKILIRLWRFKLYG